MKKHLIRKLVLECEGEMISTAETSVDDIKVTCEENNCLIHTISLEVISLHLLYLFYLASVVSIGCNYYYKRLDQKRTCSIMLI